MLADHSVFHWFHGLGAPELEIDFEYGIVFLYSS